MQSMLERVPEATRRKTGWILPLAIFLGLRAGLPEPEVVSAAERYWTGGLALGGCLVGALWQWYSPRPLVERLYNPAGFAMAFAVVFMLPFDLVDKSPEYFFWFPAGVVAGLVFKSHDDSEPTEEPSPGT
ncbi:hypothetical protein GCM10009789_29190 [Kribbella sancticallisti]|uniref:SPW repeat-containing protein n=1 Tax=Kribbella sancticallisti TaxID=460087 RepID=A0ABN2DAR2_9ACTN